MTADELRAIRERLTLATKYFLDAVEHDLAQNPPRTITEAVIISRFYPSAFEDVERLLAEVERLQLRLDVIDNLIGDARIKIDGGPITSVREYIETCEPFVVRVEPRHTGPALAAKIAKFNGGEK